MDLSDRADLIKLFLLDCFKHLENEQCSCETSEINIHDSFAKLKENVVEIVKGYDEISKKHPKEMFFLLAHRGIKEVVNGVIKSNITNDAPLLEGITTDNEIDFLFVRLISSLKESEYLESIKYVLNFILTEVYEILFEYDNIMVYAYNKIEGSYRVAETSAIRSLKEQNILLAETYSAVNKLKEENSKLKEENNKLAHKTKKQLKKFSETISKSEKEIYKDNITILGIFASVVLTVNTAVGFYTSTIEAFSGSSTYKILLVLLVIGLITTNALMGLFYFLGKVCDGKSVKVFLKDKIAGNDKKKISIKADKGVLKPLIPFIITDIILVVLLMGVILSWALGTVECRDNYIINKMDTELVDSTNIDEDNITIEDENGCVCHQSKCTCKYGYLYQEIPDVGV